MHKTINKKFFLDLCCRFSFIFQGKLVGDLSIRKPKLTILLLKTICELGKSTSDFRSKHLAFFVCRLNAIFIWSRRDAFKNNFSRNLRYFLQNAKALHCYASLIARIGITDEKSKYFQTNYQSLPRLKCDDRLGLFLRISQDFTKFSELF